MSIEGSPTSVICFCEKGDLLSQWRGYTGGGYGSSLGFIPGTLKTIASGSGFLLGKCIYDTDLQKQIIAEGVEYLITAANAEFNNEEMDRFWSVMTCCAFFKHSSFEQEQEWRLVSTTHKRYNFRKGKSMLIPYVMPITGPDNVVIDDLINRAYVGPCPHMALSNRSAEQLLLSNKIYAMVRPSSIPFRDW